jgi:hypothetical protein
LIKQKDIQARALKLIHIVMMDKEVQAQPHLSLEYSQDRDHQEEGDPLNQRVHHHIIYVEGCTIFKIIII